MDNLPVLEKVTIQDECFRLSSIFDRYNKEQLDGEFLVTNCNCLRSLKIGNSSFCDFRKFELKGVDSLQSLQFGRNCFWYADFFLQSTFIRNYYGIYQ